MRVMSYELRVMNYPPLEGIFNYPPLEGAGGGKI